MSSIRKTLLRLLRPLKLCRRLVLEVSHARSRAPVQMFLAEFRHLRVDVKVDKIRFTGGYADIYVGTMKTKGFKGHKPKVAVKRCQILPGKTNEESIEIFKNELVLWEMLKHDNVLPLLGVTTMDGVPCMVSEWMQNGTMNTYLKDHPEMNILELVRGIADGLSYMHSREVVHADLRGANVLIANDGRPVISDFGTSRLLKSGSTDPRKQTLMGSVRWMAPELINPETEENQFHTKASDVWAFGMVIYEAITGEVPYHDFKMEVKAIALIIEGQVPPKPTGARTEADYFEQLWEVCMRCWTHNPASRPTTQMISTQLSC